MEEERLVIFSFYFFVWCTACTYTPRRINPFSWLNLGPEVLVRSKGSWTRWIRTQNTIIGNEYPANFIFGFKNRDNTSSNGYEKKSRVYARNTIHANRQVQPEEPVPETVARLGFAFTRLLTRCNAWEKLSISLSGNGKEWWRGDEADLIRFGQSRAKLVFLVVVIIVIRNGISYWPLSVNTLKLGSKVIASLSKIACSISPSFIS